MEKEYLSLLDELSKDFTNPYYGDERKGKSHYAGNITTDLGRKYSDNPHYRWKGYASTEAGETDTTMLRIASADSILASEIGWKEEGEKMGGDYKKIEAEIARLDEEYASKGPFGRLFGKRKYNKQRSKLVDNRSRMAHKLNGYNANIAKELAISYNESGQYDYDGENRDFGQMRNEADNRRFFGYDDPERAKKVERAMELRKKYEAEWTKKK